MSGTENSIRGLVIVVVVGLAFAGIGGYMYQSQQQAIEAHEPVDATVVSTSVDREVTGTGDDRETKYYAEVTYEYTVDGETYRSSNVRPAGVRKGYGSRSKARSFLADYEEGQRVTAHYDPESPGEAFLVKESSTGLLLFAGFGGLVAVLGVVGLVRRLVGLAT